MICPRCTQRPLSFADFLRTLNAMRIVCSHCGAELRGNAVAYLITALHVPLALGAVEALRRLEGAQLLTTPLRVVLFFTAMLLVFFCTAFLLPWLWRGALHRAV